MLITTKLIKFSSFILYIFYHEIINFRCFSNEMKKVKIRVFLLWQKIITLSTTTFVLPNRILSKYFKKKNTINGSIAGDFKVSIYCDHHVQLTLLSFMLQCLTLCNVEPLNFPGHTLGHMDIPNLAWSSDAWSTTSRTTMNWSSLIISAMKLCSGERWIVGRLQFDIVQSKNGQWRCCV